MAYYVAQVSLVTPTHPVLAALLAWHPWAVVRVISFVILAVINWLEVWSGRFNK